jgi:hypothetical protein
LVIFFLLIEGNPTPCKCDRSFADRQISVCRKVLDRISGPDLYKTTCAIAADVQDEVKLSMLTNWTYKEHATKSRPYNGMRGVVCALGLSLSAANNFGGRLRQETSIDSRRIRH